MLFDLSPESLGFIKDRLGMTIYEIGKLFSSFPQHPDYEKMKELFRRGKIQGVSSQVSLENDALYYLNYRIKCMGEEYEDRGGRFDICREKLEEANHVRFSRDGWGRLIATKKSERGCTSMICEDRETTKGFISRVVDSFFSKDSFPTQAKLYLDLYEIDRQLIELQKAAHVCVGMEYPAKRELFYDEAEIKFVKEPVDSRRYEELGDRMRSFLEKLDGILENDVPYVEKEALRSKKYSQQPEPPCPAATVEQGRVINHQPVL